jgi:hypothetical protein
VSCSTLFDERSYKALCVGKTSARARKRWTYYRTQSRAKQCNGALKDDYGKELIATILMTKVIILLAEFSD